MGGNSVSRIETEMRRLDNARRKDFNRLWDKVSENREGITKGHENHKMLVNILNKRIEEEKGIRDEYRKGSIQKSDFLAALDKFSLLQQITIGSDN